jgi:DNA repair protein RadA/Sms
MIGAFVCSRCGTVSKSGYVRECPGCDAHHTMRARQPDLFEGVPMRAPAQNGNAANALRKARIAPIQYRDSDLVRVKTGLGTLDTALGGGFVMGATTLLAGDAGTGKSTLALRMAEAIPHSVYVACEESRDQINDRAKRTQCALACPLVTAHDDGPLQDAEELFSILLNTQTKTRGLTGTALVIVDSLQGLAGENLKAQIEAAKVLDRMCHAIGVALLVTGQVVKDGSVAGLNALKHLFDTVLMLEKQEEASGRTILVEKSRFAPSPARYPLRLSEKGWEEVPWEGKAEGDTHSSEGGTGRPGA